MKRLIYGLSLIAALTFNQSCSMEEEDLFDMSAMERLELKKEETFKELFSASNGWVMEYFPTYEANIPGYVLLVKFEQRGSDGVAQFAAKCDITGNKYVVTDGENGNAPKTAFDIDFSNGPILTFNSRNELFHKFSDPIAAGLPHDQGTGVGIGGDYEFIIIDVQPGEILLKGKKRGTYTVLRKLDENQDWEDYFKKLDSDKSNMYGGPSPLRLVVGDRYYYLYNGKNSVFDAVDGALDDLTFKEQKVFVQSLDGLRFIDRFSFEGVQAGQDYLFNKDRNRLECYEGGTLTSYIDGGLPVLFFNKTFKPKGSFAESEWVISDENMGGKILDMYNDLKKDLQEQGFYNVNYYFTFRYGVGPVLEVGSVVLDRKNFWYALSVSVQNEQGVDFKRGTEQSASWDALVEMFPSLKTFTDELNSSYKVISDSPFNYSKLKLVSQSDESSFFEINYISKTNQ